MRQALIEIGVEEDTAVALIRAAHKWGIDTPIRQQHFLAQIAAESGFVPKAENMNYTTAARLMEVWPTRFPNPERATPFLNNPELLGNTVYANRMGNGPPESGDGYRYRGRGLLQNTGKAQYEALELALGLPLLDQPDLLLDASIAADAAGWYWNARDVNSHADNNDIRAVTLAVNGGYNGLEARTYWLGVIQQAWEGRIESDRLLVIHDENNSIIGTFPIPAGADIVQRTSADGKRIWLRMERGNHQPEPETEDVDSR